MKIRELMTTSVRTVTPETPLKEVAAILAEEGISGLPVCDGEGRVLGVVSEADILYKEQARRSGRGGPFAWLGDARAYDAALKGAARTAGETMSRPAITIGPERTVAEAARLMIERKINRLPVVKGDALVGIVTRADLVRAFTRDDRAIAAEIHESVIKGALWIEPSTVSVDVTDGDVTLHGEVERRSDAEMLRTLVARVPGVVSVHSDVLWHLDDRGGAHGSLAGPLLRLGGG